MPSYQPLREATAEDAERILELITISDIARVGEPETTITAIETDFASHGYRGAVLDDAAGSLAGYAWVDHPPGHSLVAGDIVARPGAEMAVSEQLLRWLRAAASGLGDGLELHVFADTDELGKQAMYESVGGTVIRHSYRMAIETAGMTFGAPPLRDGVEIRPVAGEADLRTMHAVVDTAFLDHFGHEREPYDHWLQHSAQGVYADLSLWWLATVVGEPAAGLYGGILPASGYVDTLGTLRAYRGLGLGRALLLTALAEYERRGVGKVTLGVDATNPTGAVHLYESVGMRIEHEGLRYRLPALT
jgi:ribosomal protein S18 acetylase RimI-like enzyme